MFCSGGVFYRTAVVMPRRVEVDDVVAFRRQGRQRRVRRCGLPVRQPVTMCDILGRRFALHRYAPNAKNNSAATNAPPSVAAKFTASLSIQATPWCKRVGDPQACGFVSQARSHCGHQRRACNAAPIAESASDPAMPAKTTGANGATPVADAHNATTAAPAIEAPVPAAVIPPDKPVATRRNVKIERGGWEDNTPISVAHVSAAAAANAPAKAAANAALPCDANSAQTAATPPLANTSRASRGPSLPASFNARLRAEPIRESSADGTKNANNTAAAGQPPAPNVAEPTSHAATAPSAE